ncbi:MAG: BamA/TamA family outer membrane protein, partial [Elusimicrobia bacterium]|nr:BamA/TamA family outer membrane protein [Elusimicrobiota bacterium]
LDLSDGTSTVLADLPGAARDPVVSADGKRVLFALEAGDTYDVHELELATGKVTRLTRTIGGAYAPCYAPGGGIAFASLRGGSVSLHAAPRAAFGADPPAGVGGETPPPAVSTTTTSAPFRAPSPYTTDLFLPAFFYSSSGGVFWTSYYQGSDLFGRHTVTGLVSYASGLGYLDYQGQYAYRRWRPDLVFGASGFLRRDVLDPDTGASVNQSVHQQSALASYPLDRYDRAEFQLSSVVERDQSDYAPDQVSHDSRSAGAQFVRDTVRGRYLVEAEGGRLRAGYSVSPRLFGGNAVNQGAFAEAQRFIPTGGLSALALRVQTDSFWGPDLPQYILGGIGGVRGYARSTTENAGTAGAVATAEWRIPVLPHLDYYMWYIFPDFYFKMLSMTLFTDAGRVWSARRDLAASRWNDVRQSYGVGLSLETFILQMFPLTVNFDYARRTTSDGGVFYVYLGPLF